MVMLFIDYKNGFNNLQLEMMFFYFIFYMIQLVKKYELFWFNLYDGVSK